MKKLVLIVVSGLAGVVLTLLLLGIFPTARAGGGAAVCSSQNGDVNADGKIDLTDAVTILAHLFQGSPSQLLQNCDTPPALLSLPATGQGKCYDAAGAEVPCDTASCRGQDGSYATGCAPEGRFMDNGDGTVTDSCTGLEWQKDAADTNGDGKWTNQDTLAWCAALNYCEDLTFAGHDDWRLPNVRELQSLVDYGRTAPALDPSFGALSGQPCWSSTTIAGNGGVLAWTCGFGGGAGGGIVASILKSGVALVRAVRNAP